jgi:hypothetical protein
MAFDIIGNGRLFKPVNGKIGKPACGSDRLVNAPAHTTASALSSVRSIGTAFGAAIAGVVANVAGLGEATEPGAVGNAITAVYIFCCIPFGLAALLMFRFVHIVFGKRRGPPGPT